VVQNIVFTLTDYGVPEDQILGIRYGLRGFYEREDKPITLTRDTVDGIHLKGGTMLVSGRDTLYRLLGWQLYIAGLCACVVGAVIAATESHQQGREQLREPSVNGLLVVYEREDKPISLARVNGIHLKGGTMLVGGAACMQRYAELGWHQLVCVGP
jgi:6-phosphofructokinase